MQLDELVLYSKEGAQRSLAFQRGRLNIVTGDSRTGKSSLIDIIRFCLGSGNPHAPHGPIQDTVAWYGLHASIGETRFFIARPAPSSDSETGAAMLIVEPSGTPGISELSSTSSASAVRQYLDGLLGIEENVMPASSGQTRPETSATFVHSLYYCFQGQGEIANPEILFHHQNRDWQAQTIRDTMPYFLGAIGLRELRARQDIADVRRQLRRAQQRLRRARELDETGLEGISVLLDQARDAGLAVPDMVAIDAPSGRAILSSLVTGGDRSAAAVSQGGEFDRLIDDEHSIRQQLRLISQNLRGLDDFASVDEAYRREVDEQRARLAAIELVPRDDDPNAACPVCGRPIEEHGASVVGDIRDALGLATRHLETAQRDRPRIEQARSNLLAERAGLERQLDAIRNSLASLARTDEIARAEASRLDLQSYVRGRIAQYLDSSEDATDIDIAELQSTVDALTMRVDELSSTIDPDAIRSRTVSRLAIVSRTITDLAQALSLEHSAAGVRLDLDRLTIVADTPSGPAYLDRGEIGSGMNWVGYHIATYLALQAVFIQWSRPVPRFLVLDQLSQAFFPRDRQSGGDLSDLSDSDREHTRQIYRLIYDTVAQAGGRLQVIALDHADFADQWFASSVVARWRDGNALIPHEWYV